MFAVNNSEQDPWVGDDMQAGSLVSSVSGQSRSELDNFAAEKAGGKQASNPLAHALGNGPTKTPGVLRTGEAALMRNGQPVLPMEKAFSIQIGWRLFRLSGASIMSDGKQVANAGYVETVLKSLERPPTSLPTLTNSCD